MGSGKRKKKREELAAGSVELNVMPFVDIFSLLCTFLLFSAVFVSIGILEVQIPFLSNAAPSSEDSGEDERTISLRIEVDKKEIILSTSFSKPPAEDKKFNYPKDPAGIGDLHRDLLKIREKNRKTDKVTLFVDDDIIYDELVAILDQIKFRGPEDPGFVEGESGRSEGNLLYPKVVMGNILL